MSWQKISDVFRALFFKKSALNYTQLIGQQGENAAASHVRRLGMRILYRNWRHKKLEIDIICEDSEGFVFVEVKTRKADGMTSPIEAITPQKREALTKAAQIWLAMHEAHIKYDKPYRFAVASVTYSETLSYHVEFYDHAFEDTTDSL